jgi:hypothetical protein
MVVPGTNCGKTLHFLLCLIEIVSPRGIPKMFFVFDDGSDELFLSIPPVRGIFYDSG